MYNNGAWFYRAWLPAQQPLGMAYKELFRSSLHVTFGISPGLINALRFSVITITLRTFYNPALPRKKNHAFVRALFLVTAKFNFRVRAEHLQGKTNQIADSLSRFNL